jgi:hypothetical protein
MVLKVHIKWGLLLMFSVATLVLISFPLPSMADSMNDGVFGIDSKPYGMSYEDWTIKWWRWALSMPSDINPNVDKTGQYCAERQGNLSAFFLAGGSGSTVERTCTVPVGKAILIPVSTVECSFLELPTAKTDQDLSKCAEEDQSSPVMSLAVDGREIKELNKYRVPSRAFDINFSENNIFAVSGPTRAVSDGYWIMLEPLNPGMHEIHYKAALTNPTTGILDFNDDVKYNLKVK